MKKLRITRPVILALATALSMALMARFWPHKITGMPEERWNQIKSDWHHDADVVILGDSRSASDLLPREMSSTLRIANFAFPGNAYLDDYLSRGLAILDPSAKRRVLIIGMSSKTLTRSLEGWPPVAARSWSEVWKWRHLPELLGVFARITKWELVNTLRGKPELGTWREFRADGSFVGGAVWGNAGMPPVEGARSYLAGHAIDEAIVAELMRTVAKARADGIEVYGVRLPSSTAVDAIEEEVHHFSEADFADKFRGAGGTWITVPDRTDYQTYDHSHLIQPDAERFSRWFAEQLRLRDP